MAVSLDLDRYAGLNDLIDDLEQLLPQRGEGYRVHGRLPMMYCTENIARTYRFGQGCLGG
jgi:hypothetical protein